MGKMKLLNNRGITLVGDFYAGSSKSLVVISHGLFGERSGRGKFTILAKALVLEGFSVASFDFAGSGESGDEIMTVEREIEDIDFLINHFSKEGYTLIGLLGNSLGGYVSIKNSDARIAALVLWNPLTSSITFDWKKWFTAEHIKIFEVTDILKYIFHGKKIFGDRKEMLIGRDAINRFNSIDQKSILENISTPTLLLQGTEDDVILPKTSKKAFTYLNENSKFHLVPGADHSIGDTLPTYIAESVHWFKVHMK
jgi:pimeloyl-ACP methyl ester carboxylesterase